MTAVNVFVGVMTLVMVVTISFALMMMLPGIIECIADVIIDIRWAMDKLKDALRGDKDGK